MLFNHLISVDFWAILYLRIYSFYMYVRIHERVASSDEISARSSAARLSRSFLWEVILSKPSNRFKLASLPWLVASSVASSRR